jgi:glycoside/pentoside/hexuronide:cation symporter, GPH family
VALAYGLPNFGLAIMLGPVQGLLQGYFTQNYNIKLEAIAWIFVIAPLVAAVVDPVVGMVADHYRHRFWGRRSWLVGAVLLSMLSTYHLLVVPPNLSVAYCAAWVILGFIAWTVSEITYNAWGTELTSNYDSRTMIFSYKSALGFVGTLLFLAFPFLLGLYQTHVQGAKNVSSGFTPQTMHLSCWGLLALMPVFTVIALWVCPDGTHVRRTERRSPGKIIRILLSNKAMLVFLTTYVVLGISGGLQTAMAYLHLSSYLGLGQDASLIYTIACTTYLFGVPVWNWVAAQKGKHVALIIGLAVNVVLFVALGLIQPSTGVAVLLGKSAAFWQYLLVICGLNFSQVVYYSVAPAIIGDISDHALLATREDQSATYFASYTFVYKLALGTGWWLALYLAGAVFGFDPKASVQTAAAALGVRTMMGYMPAALVLVAVLVMLRYPITRAKQTETQQRIRELGLKVED